MTYLLYLTGNAYTATKRPVIDQLMGVFHRGNFSNDSVRSIVSFFVLFVFRQSPKKSYTEAEIGK